MTIENLKLRRWSKPSSKARATEPLIEGDSLDGSQSHPGRLMTEKEFLSWVEEKTRAEWIDGEVIIMSLVNSDHDDLQGWLNAILRAFVERRGLGRISGSELAVRFSKPKARRLTDLFFVAKERVADFDKTSFQGPPDLIIEIVSPDSTKRDYREKLKMYESSGVKEYWIIDPLSQSVEVNELVRTKYRAIEPRDGMIHSKVLKGFWLRLNWFNQRPLPFVLDVLKELGIK